MLTKSHKKSYLMALLWLFLFAQASLVAALDDDLLYEPITDITFTSDKPHLSEEGIFIRTAVKNTSTEVLSGSFRVVVENASLPVTNAAGLTQLNEPYFLLRNGDVVDVKAKKKVYSHISFNQTETIPLSYDLRLERRISPSANKQPVANAGFDQFQKTGDLVYLDGSRCYDLDGEALSYDWLLEKKPAGSLVTLVNNDKVNPHFKLDIAGQYVISLLVNDGIENSYYDRVVITTSNVPPVAQAGASQLVIPGDIVQLDGSFSSDANGDNLSYSWVIDQSPDGSAALLEYADTVKPQLNIDHSGEYIIRLKVNDASIESDDSHITISDVALPPVANAGLDQSAIINAIIQLDASASFALDAQPLSYSWVLISAPDNSSASLSEAQVMNPTIQIDQPGDYIVQLMVNDGSQSSIPDQMIISTSNVRPVARAGENMTVPVNVLTQLNAANSFDADGDLLSYQWFMIHQPETSLTSITNVTDLLTNFIADVSGQYVVQLVVNDGLLDSYAGTILITADEQTNQPPVIQSSPVPGAQTDILYSYNVIANDDDGDSLTFTLTQSPAGMIIGSSSGLITWTPTVAGSYPVTVQVSDGRGGVDEKLFVVAVTQSNRGPVITSIPVTQAAIDQPYTYQVVANDADADVLSYRLLVSPLGMNINSSTGLISWQVVNFETVTVNIEVDDANGGITSQQYSVSTNYPTDNQPPVFAPLASQIVPIGTTLSLQFNAYDPEGRGISYSVLPLPLPANATLYAQTGTLLFEPQAGQDGEYNLLISASDSRFSTSQNLKITVPSLDLAAPTSFHGRVVDANSASQGVDLPIVGATISFLNTTVSTVTDAQGYFTLNNLPPTAEVFSIDGSTANLAPGGASYASFRELLTLIEHSNNIEERPFYMPRNNMASMTQVDPNQTTMVENEELGVKLEIPPYTATNEDGTSFLGQISISEVPNGLAPASMPENFNPGLLITIQPAGIRFSTPVPITFPNTDNLPPGTEFSIMSVDPDTGMFAPVGTAVVSADGKSIITTSGGIREADWHFPSVQAIDDFFFGKDDNAGTNGCDTGSTTCLKDGRMSQTVSLPEYRSLEENRAVSLIYQTSRAGRVVQALQNLGSSALSNLQRIPVKITYKLVRPASGGGGVQLAGPPPTPDYTKITTTIAGVEGLETYLGLPPANQNNVFTGVALEAEGLGTGMYTARTSVVVKVGFSISGLSKSTETMIINESNSPFGAGWMIENVDRLHFHATTGTALLVSADGRYKVYKFNEVSQSYATPKGDYSTLIKGPDSTYILVDQFGNSSFFDTHGLQTERQDLNGNSTLYTYNSDAELISIMDPVGKLTMFNYVNGRVVSITDPANRISQFEHDALGNLTRIIYPDSSEIKYEYVGHLLTKKTDERNNVTEYHYDEEGFNTHVTLPDNSQRGVRSSLSKGFAVKDNTINNPLDSFFDATSGTYLNARGNISEFELDAHSFITKGIDSLGRITLYERDTNSRPLKTTRPNGSEITKTFDTLGNTTSEREEFNGALYQYTYDSHSLITKITNPNKHSLTITRDASGNPVEIVNELGHTTTIDFNTRGLPTRIVIPNTLEIVRLYNTDGLLETQIETPPADSPGNVRTSQYQYFSSGLLKQVNTADGRTYNYTYDQRSRLLGITDNPGQKQSAQYDSYGNIIAVDTTNADGSDALHVEYNYDSRNRLTEMRLPHQKMDAITRLLLDGEDNVFELVDPKGSQRKMHYDKVDRLDENTHRLNGVSQYSYDLNDKITKVISPNGATTDYSYDLLGRRLSETGPDRGAIQYQYDLADNLTQKIDARGVITDYTYDELERLTSKTFPTSPTENVTLQYDTCPLGVGRLCQIIDETGSSDYQYDAWGNIIQQQKTELGKIYVTTYQYDKGNNIKQMIYPSGRIISITRDGVRRIQSIQTSLSQNGATINKILMDNSLYRADNQLRQCSFGNGLTENRSYDLQGRLTGQNTNNGVSITDQRLYDYDINSNLISITGNEQSSNYDYDLLDRLTQDNPSSTQNLAARQSFLQYDQNHNRQRKTSYLPDLVNTQSIQTKAYSYNSLSNQLLAEEMLSENISLTGSSEYEQLQYNAANRLSHRTVSNGNGNGELIKATDYLYNAQGQRTRKISHQQNGSSITTLYHYNLQGQLITETNELGTNIRDYVWHNLSPIAQIEHNQQTVNDELYYLHTDHLFTPRFATNENKEIIWRWEGEAFGETEAESDVDTDGQLVTINLRFPGQYYDVESGLHYNYFRDYDPTIGRYITSDPIGQQGGINTYSYANSNPTKYSDPLGLLTPAGLVIGGSCFAASGASAIAGIDSVAKALETFNKTSAELDKLSNAYDCEKSDSKKIDLLKKMRELRFQASIDLLKIGASGIGTGVALTVFGVVCPTVAAAF